MTLSTVAGAPCPKCAVPTVAASQAAPWCPECEWNLDSFEPGRSWRHFGWRWLDRRLHRTAYRLTAGQFTALSSAGPDRPASAARILTVTAASVLFAAVLALAAAGVWLVGWFFFSPATLLGALLIGIAVVLRPRFGRLKDLSGDAVVLDPATAPALFQLVGRVAAAVDAPTPDIVLLGPEFNAFTATVGLRRRRVLSLGAELWAALDPPEQVALLGHELGHFVNGDVRRGLLTGSATAALVRVAYLLTPAGSRGRGLLGLLTGLAVNVLLGVLRWLVLGLHLLLLWISQRDSQRAEYLADDMAATAGGTAAAVGLTDTLLLRDPIDTVVRREARARNGMAAWRAAATAARANLAGEVPVLRQLSRRDNVSLFASHPPAGLRSRMIELRPPRPAAVTASVAESERIDQELAAPLERMRRELAH